MKSAYYVLLFFLGLLAQNCSAPTKESKLEQIRQEVEQEDYLEISAVGDIMLGSTFPSEDGLTTHDGKESFDAIKPFLTGDIIFGNLEGVLLDGDHPPKCKDSLSKNCYVFKMPERYGKVLKEAGFNLISIANNHISDFKGVGRKSTATVLDSLNIQFAGLLSKPTAIFKQGGITYGFAAFAPNAYTVSMLDLKKATTLISKLKKETDIVIVSFHGGAEGTEFERLPKAPETYIGENRGDVYAFAHTAIDAGADLVLGHGPHVTRSVEVYKNKFISYSLGNFVTHGKINILGASGIAPLLTIKLKKNGDFKSSRVISTYQTKSGGLQVDSLNRAFHKLKNLTDADFQGHQLDFSELGFIKLLP